MQLSRSSLTQLKDGGITVPDEKLFSLPEKVLQFGTGVLLRGLPDYFINKANEQGLFNGRIVVVKSTATGGTDVFSQQDGLFTHLEQGYENGQQVARVHLNSSVSRVLSAKEEWEKILDCAASPDMQVVISNTTEVGIVLVPEDATAQVPVSFPAKLLVFLLKRYEAFKGSRDAGMVIIPTELITDNGIKLKAIVLKLAELKGCTQKVIDWLAEANDFCSSLVDRIVPGKPSVSEAAAMQQRLGYEDGLMIMSECYRLWAIETRSERTRKILSFSAADSGVILATDINQFRELKLRLLNGTHTFSCGLAFLAGFATVRDAMKDEAFTAFISQLMLDEIAPLIVSDTITGQEANTFAGQVLDRFRNTYIEHLWINITVQYSSKMTMRNVPLLQKYYALNGEAPSLMALGLAAYILFMKPVDGGRPYKIEDDRLPVLEKYWHQYNDKRALVEAILADRSIWGNDLTIFPRLTDAVSAYLASLMQYGAKEVLQSVISKRSVA